MVFMKACRQGKYEDFEAQGAYVDYKRMKLILHEMKATHTMTTPDELFGELVRETKKVYEWCVKKLDELTSLAERYALPYLSEEVQAVLRAKKVQPLSKPPKEGKELKEAADSLLNEVLRFQECRNLNTDIIQRILKRERLYTVLPPTSKWSRVDERWNFKVLKTDEVFYLLSTIYSAVRSEHDDREQKAGDQGSQSFNRRSVKYWVHHQDLPFVIGRVIQHLPLSTFNDVYPIARKNKPDQLSALEDIRALDVLEDERELSEGFAATAGGGASPILTPKRAPANANTRSSIASATESDNILLPASVTSAAPADGLTTPPQQRLPSALTKSSSSTLGTPHQPTKKSVTSAAPTSAQRAAGAPHESVYTLGSAIGSVYFDNADFLFYHRRLERLEGSSLFRIRWYGSDYLEPNDRVFMELKVHHEAWTGESSNKRRFTLKEQDVDSFLRRELNLTSEVEKLIKKGRPEKEILEFKQLACEVLTKVSAYDLRPVLRTHYVRSAFQRGTDQKVRISIDTHMRLTAEDFGSSKHWRYAGRDEMTYRDFPYAVVEVKLQCEENEKIAPWIEELMQCRFMESIPKFSKYAHGMSALYGDTNKVDLVPYWLNQLNHEIRAVTKLDNDAWDRTRGLVEGCWDRLADRAIFGNPMQAGTNPEVGAREALFLPDEHSEARLMKYQTMAEAGYLHWGGAKVTTRQRKRKKNRREDGGSTSFSDDDEDGDGGKGDARAVVVTNPTLSRRRTAYEEYKVHTDLNCQSNDANAEAGCFNLFASEVLWGIWGGSGRRDGEKGAPDSDFLHFRPRGFHIGGKHVPESFIPYQSQKRVRVPHKYDPKTLLQAERQFLKWVQHSMTLGLAGIATLHWGAPRDRMAQHMLQDSSTSSEYGGSSSASVTWSQFLWFHNFHVGWGITMVILALLGLSYSLMTYHSRTKRMYGREKLRFDDVNGPTCLAVAMIVYVIVTGGTRLILKFGSSGDPLVLGSNMGYMGLTK